MRPKSIEQFAMIYGAIIVLGLISTWLSWDDMQAQVSVQQMTARFGPAAVYIVAGLGLLIQALLWYFICQRGSVIAKWVFVVLTALAILSGLWGVAMGGLTMTLAAAVSLLLLVLQAAAVWLLFRPDTPEWFGELYDDAA